MARFTVMWLCTPLRSTWRTIRTSRRFSRDEEEGSKFSRRFQSREGEGSKAQPLGPLVSMSYTGDVGQEYLRTAFMTLSDFGYYADRNILHHLHVAVLCKVKGGRNTMIGGNIQLQVTGEGFSNASSNHLYIQWL